MQTYYKPKFYRHLNHLVINGFYARSLDADDHAFIEQVKVRGIANGDLPNTSAVLIEELEFWHLPYAIAPDIERRVGKKPRVAETPEEFERRKLRTSAWHARRTIRKQERAIADIELDRERREWQEDRDRRQIRDLISDAEWDAAAPKEASFGTTVNRHHVPEWRLEEQGIVKPVVEGKRSRLMSRAEVREAIWLRTEAQKVKQRKLKERELKAQIRKDMIAAQANEAQINPPPGKRRSVAKPDPTPEATQLDRAAATLAKRAALKRDAEIAKELGLTARAVKERRRAVWLTKQEIARREKIMKEARETVARVDQMKQEWQGLPNVSDNLVKDAIMTLLKRSPGQVWTGPDMARAVGCADVEQMNRCLDELVRSGRLKTDL